MYVNGGVSVYLDRAIGMRDFNSTVKERDVLLRVLGSYTRIARQICPHSRCYAHNPETFAPAAISPRQCRLPICYRLRFCIIRFVYRVFAGEGPGDGPARRQCRAVKGGEALVRVSERSNRDVTRVCRRKTR